jgi:type IV pilus assembly protein PilO
VHFVNRLDRSSRFLILDSLAAAPQQQGGILMITFKLNAFVREARL